MRVALLDDSLHTYVDISARHLDRARRAIDKLIDSVHKPDKQAAGGGSAGAPRPDDDSHVVDEG